MKPFDGAGDSLFISVLVNIFLIIVRFYHIFYIKSRNLYIHFWVYTFGAVIKKGSFLRY